MYSPSLELKAGLTRRIRKGSDLTVVDIPASVEHNCRNTFFDCALADEVAGVLSRSDVVGVLESIPDLLLCRSDGDKRVSYCIINDLSIDMLILSGVPEKRLRSLLCFFSRIAFLFSFRIIS